MIAARVDDPRNSAPPRRFEHLTRAIYIDLEILGPLKTVRREPAQMDDRVHALGGAVHGVSFEKRSHDQCCRLIRLPFGLGFDVKETKMTVGLSKSATKESSDLPIRAGNQNLVTLLRHRFTRSATSR